MDRDDRVLAIVLAAEHLLGLAGLHFGGELVEPLRKIAEDVLARLQPLDEHDEVVGAALQRLAERDVRFERLAALQRLLRGGLVLPEIGIGGLLLYLRELVAGPGRVKDSSADRTRAW
jgi:hypothetical protein